MDVASQRMTDPDRKPDAKALSAWLGRVNYSRWTSLSQYIETTYPGVFAPEWLFGGKKYGWVLRFKKSKSFCTLIPERKRLVVLIVFGQTEREEAETILDELSPTVREGYNKATTYHDGKWVALTVARDETLRDIQRLLTVKRQPKTKGTDEGDRRLGRKTR